MKIDYIPITNILDLEKDKSWRKKTPLKGINFNKNRQISNIKTIMSPFIDEYKDGKIYENAPGFKRRSYLIQLWNRNMLFIIFPHIKWTSW